MSELRSLIEQRKEIDRQIREHREHVYRIDGAGLRRDGDFWLVTLQEIDCRYMLNKREGIYKRIVTAVTKEDCIKGLKVLIGTLITLYEKITGETYAE